MRTYRALGIKFAMTLFAAAAAGLISGLTNWWLILLVGLIGTIVNYIVGDMMVLPAAGNMMATIGDGIMAGLLAYLIAISGWAGANVLIFAVSFGVIVMVGEYFVHKYLLNNPVNKNPLE